MQSLPHGWRIHNSTADVTGPPIPTESDESETEDVDIQPDSDGWEDLEDDTEAVAVQCLLCSENFPEALIMIEHCKTSHEFDFLKIRQDFGMDFYATIKFVNYIRSQTQAGARPDVTDASAWSDDKYLQPVLEDDAFLFNIDDIGDDEKSTDAKAEE